VKSEGEKNIFQKMQKKKKKRRRTVLTRIEIDEHAKRTLRLLGLQAFLIVSYLLQLFYMKRLQFFRSKHNLQFLSLRETM